MLDSTRDSSFSVDISRNCDAGIHSIECKFLSSVPARFDSITYHVHGFLEMNLLIYLVDRDMRRHKCKQLPVCQTLHILMNMVIL